MKIIYKGMLESRTRGCPVCKRSSSTKMATMKTFILPSGITKTFRVGRTEEVTDRDGAFLLTYKDGKGNSAFEVV